MGFNRRNPKAENRNPKPTAKVGCKRRNPKPETRNRQRKLVSIDETRNPKPTAKISFNWRNPKPETRNRQRKLVSIDETRNPKPETRNPKPETRNPKPTRIRLLGGSPDRNSQHDTSFAECTHARAWLAHGACKFYRWERSHIYL